MANFMELISANYPNLVISCLGDPSVYENITLISGDQLPTIDELNVILLNELKIEQVTMLSEACNKQIISGFTSSALGYPCIYDSEEVDQLNLIGSSAVTAPTPANPDGSITEYAVRKIVDGVTQPKEYVFHSYANLREVMADGAIYKLSLLQKFNNKRNYINNQTTSIDQVLAVTWDSVEPS